MPEAYNILTDRDMADLRRFLRAERSRLTNTVTHRTDQEQGNASPDVYVAMPPCGDEIPRRIGETPGAAICCIFKIRVWPQNDNQPPVIPANRTLSPVLNLDGTQLRRTVYNVYDYAIPADVEYVIIRRTAYGRWVVEAPPTGPTTTTTTTPNPSTTTTTTSAPIPNPCLGTCTYVFSASSYYWNLVADNCQPGTTTTPPPPVFCEGEAWWTCMGGGWVYTSDTCGTDCEASGTPIGPCVNGTVIQVPCISTIKEDGSVDTCLCPGTGEDSIYTTTTTPNPSTTTTPAPPPECNCMYPSWCGAYDGQSTTTYCTDRVDTPPIECPPTTTTTPDPSTTTTQYPPLPTTPPPATTTCDCNTTTTAVPTTTTPAPDCSQLCRWEWLPEWGGGFDWINTAMPCGPTCPCEKPPFDGVACQVVETPCVTLVIIEPPDPPPIACVGSCVFWYIPRLGVWILTDDTCNRHEVSGCECQTPSAPSSGCSPATVPCTVRTPTPTTPNPPDPDPCAPCYTTTTTASPETTTTCRPCGYPCEYCEYISSDECNSLILVSSNCSGGCSCPESYGHTEGPPGSTHRFPCIDDPGTPTTPPPPGTTTTCAPCNSYCSKCRWKFSAECGNRFVRLHNPCNPECPCEEPLIDPADPPWPGMETETPCRIPPDPPTTIQPPTTACPTTTTQPPTTTTTTTTPAPTTTVCPTTTSTTETVVPLVSETGVDAIPAWLTVAFRGLENGEAVDAGTLSDGVLLLYCGEASSGLHEWRSDPLEGGMLFLRWWDDMPPTGHKAAIGWLGQDVLYVLSHDVPVQVAVDGGAEFALIPGVDAGASYTTWPATVRVRL